MTLASFWGKILAEEKKRGKSQSRAVVHQQQIKCDLLFGKSNNTHRRTTQKNSHSSRKMREKNCIRTKRLTVTDDNGRFEENRVAEPSSSQPSPSFHCVNPSSGRSEKDEEQKLSNCWKLDCNKNQWVGMLKLVIVIVLVVVVVDITVIAMVVESKYQAATVRIIVT